MFFKTTGDELRWFILRAASIKALLLAVSLLLWFSLPSPHAQAADVQKSELFVATAKKLMRYTTMYGLKSACNESKAKALCLALVSAMEPFIEAAIDGELDRDAAVLGFHRFQREAMVAAAIYAFEDKVGELLLQPLEHTLDAGGKADLNTLLTNANRCIAGTMLGGDFKASCLEISTHRSKACSRVHPSPLVSRASAREYALCSIREAFEAELESSGDIVGFRIALRQLGLAADAASRQESLFKQVHASLRAVDKNAAWMFGRVASNRMFSDRSIQDAIDDLRAQPAKTCPQPEKEKRIEELVEFRAKSLEVARSFSVGVTEGQPLPRNRLPQHSLSGPCISAEGAYRDWLTVANAYVFMQTTFATLHRWRPSLLGAALFLDQVMEADKIRLQYDARSLLAESVHLLVARRLGSSLRCSTAESGNRVVTCSDVAGGVPVQYEIDWTLLHTSENQVVDAFWLLLERTHTIDASRATCVGQAIGAALSNERVGLYGKLGAACVLAPALREFERQLLPALSRLGVSTEPMPGFVDQPADGRQLVRWTESSIDRGLTTARLRLSSEAAVGIAAEAALAVASATAGKQSSNTDNNADLVRSLAQPLLHRINFDGTGAFKFAAKSLEPGVKSFLKAAFSLEKCEQSPRGKVCLVANQALAVYEPLLAYSSGVISEDELIRSAIEATTEADPLSRSPFLVSIGLAYSGIWTEDPDERVTHHLTVLDKWGLALRFGPRNQFHAGVFVGGFIDALIRAAVEGPEESFWLAGAVLGIRQFHQSFPLGLELHGAWAPRTDFDSVKGAGFGATLVLPIGLLFEKGN